MKFGFFRGKNRFKIVSRILKKSIANAAIVRVYSDDLVSGGSFADKQWFSSGATSTFSYGNGEMRQLLGTSARHILCHFDCLREQYPLYDANTTYSASGGISSVSPVDGASFNDGTFEISQGSGTGGVIKALGGVFTVISPGTGYVNTINDGTYGIRSGGARYVLSVPTPTVYAGRLGHALYKKMSAQNGSPSFLSLSDTNGWSRVRPPAREIELGKTLNISFRLKLDRTGFTVSATNAIRVGVLQSTGSYINFDNHTTSNAGFTNYSGYMFTYGPTSVEFFRRNAGSSSSLVNSTSAYTKINSQSLGGWFGSEDEYIVQLSLQRTVVGGYMSLTSSIRSAFTPSNESTIGSTDLAPATSFDTLCFWSTSNNVASLAISNPVITYS